MSTAVIRDAAAADAPAMARIYNHYIRETVVTFEEEEIDPEEMAARIEGLRAESRPCLVAEEAGEVVGYAYAGMWQPRSAYRFTVQTSVYLDPGRTGGGIGTALFERLFELLREGDAHVVMAGIALPNAESVALHEKFGMRQVAHFHEVGFKFGRWVDVGLWELVLT